MRILTVRELTSHIKGLLENDRLLANLWVKGEISNCRPANSGHIYFTLKDGSSCIRAVMFRSRAVKLRFRPGDGMSVRVRGYVSVYERDGSYQLYAEEMEPDGVGALYAAFEQLKEKLMREGLFDQARKKRIPLLPKRVGIVTSPTGAVIRDMVQIIRRRWPGTGIILAPVTVQGETAPGEVARGIRSLNALGGVDVIIVGRGGGSLEELWAFNTEEVARSIAMSSVPVISAVGHETDFTIADMAADLRAPTPSAAAELAVPVKADVARALEVLKTRMNRAMDEKIGQCRRRLEACLRSPAFRRPVENICGPRSVAADMLSRNLAGRMKETMALHRGRLAELAGRLNALSPLATMARGYSVCISERTGEILRDADGLRPGDGIRVDLHRGSVRCGVKEVLAENRRPVRR
ncbi:MAG: exodeoxyribonuclease VII large subunit [Peptococcaceae bacterium]|nr:exodeoxyribonuclease VII large subunit [Peptococcaceae bacterium]